jgi:hypothetical protein
MLLLSWQADFLAGLPPPSPVSPLEAHGRSPRHISGCTFLPGSRNLHFPNKNRTYLTFSFLLHQAVELMSVPIFALLICRVEPETKSQVFVGIRGICGRRRVAMEMED